MNKNRVLLKKMNSKQMMLSDVPVDVIIKWTKMPVDIRELKEATHLITQHQTLFYSFLTIQDQIGFIKLQLGDITLEQYAYSFLYIDSKKMRDLYKVVYEYYEQSQPQKEETIHISLINDYDDVSEVIVIEDDIQLSSSSTPAQTGGRICGICFENEVDGIILPCAHMCCYKCASDDRIKLCPEFACRKPVKRVIKGYFI